jgi:hypothetical protein
MRLLDVVTHRIFSLALAGILGLVAGCAGPQAIAAQMSAEYGCSNDAFTITQLSGNTYAGTGCGHQDSFVCTPQHTSGEPQCFKRAQPDDGVK